MDVFSCICTVLQKDKVEDDKLGAIKLELDGTKKFSQIEPIAIHPQLNWYLILRIDGSADIAPGMDTIEKSTYKINGNNLTIKTNRGEFYEFEILSETDVKLKGDSVILRWNKIN